MVSRRTLFLGGGAAAVAAVSGAAGLFGNLAEVDALDRVPDRTFTYRGRSVTVTESGTMVMVGIDGQRQLHIDRPARYRFYSHLVPFQEFTTSRQLITTLIDLEDDRLFTL